MSEPAPGSPKDHWQEWDIEGFLASTFTSDQNLTLEQQIDILSFLVDVLRYRAKHYETEMPFEHFVQGCIAEDDGTWRYVPPARLRETTSGIPPVQYQPDLLLFLLFHHQEKYAIYDIIRLFIDWCHEKLSVIDFKRTQTGVLRCFTNTRFAAATLREYGLLKFTDVEAYKTWTLSLTGFVAGSWLLQQRLRRRHPQFYYALPAVHKDIIAACNAVEDYDSFLCQLTFICAPNVELFKTFRPFLKEAYKLAEDYWKALQNRSLKQEERRKLCFKIAAELEGRADATEFYSELSKCLHVEALLSEVKPELPKSKPDQNELLF